MTAVTCTSNSYLFQEDTVTVIVHFITLSNFTLPIVVWNKMLKHVSVAKKTDS